VRWRTIDVGESTHELVAFSVREGRNDDMRLESTRASRHPLNGVKPTAVGDRDSNTA
jgi:hypothetical protein